MNDRLLVGWAAAPPSEEAEASSRALVCAHCGTPANGAPTALQSGAARDANASATADEPWFCCAGCATVYRVLREAGLEDYYAYRERVGAEAAPVQDSGGEFSELDAASFQALYCGEEAGGERSAELALSGLHCAACVWLVERLPRVAPAVREARVDLARNTVRVVWDPSIAPLSHVGGALARLGYVPSAPRGLLQEKARQKELRSLLVRIGVAGACAGNVMLLAFALYSSGAGAGGESVMDASTRRFFEVGSLLLSLPALIAGSLFFRGAWAALRTRTPHMDLPIALGIGVAFLWGGFEVFAGSGELYFDSITVLVFLLLVGRYLQRRHQLSAAEAAELLHSVMPVWAKVVSGANELEGGAGELESASGARADARVERAPVESVVVGSVVEVASGDIVPVDGWIIRGSSALDMSLLSGESEPVDVGVGSRVQAGCLNRGGLLWVRAERTSAETRVAELLRSVERALSERTRLVSEADRIAGVFTVAILALAFGTALFWSFREPGLALPSALSLLIVACPCALAMATPLALSAASRQAAARKILFFRVQAIERLARPCEVVLDKTGTLTDGRLTLTSWEGSRRSFELVRQAESISEHPIARALREAPAASSGSEAPPELEELREEIGRGICGKWRGEPIVVGSVGFAREAITSAEELAQLEQRTSRGPEGASPLVVVVGGRLQAIGWLEDRLRPGVERSLTRLVRAGHRLTLLSGDHPNVASRVARELSARAGGPLFVEVRGGVSPEGKLDFIEKKCGAERSVVMVGDGVNDAAALARADVGVAVRGAAEASRLSADVFLSSGGASDLDALFSGARRTLMVIRRGIGFSLVYNAVGVSLAASALLSPLAAAVLMPLSSITVVTNAYRSRSFAARRREPRAKESS